MELSKISRAPRQKQAQKQMCGNGCRSCDVHRDERRDAGQQQKITEKVPTDRERESDEGRGQAAGAVWPDDEAAENARNACQHNL